MESIFPGYDNPVPKRSTFLTVLCILTFLWSAYSIIGNTVTLANPKKAADDMKMGFVEANKEREASKEDQEMKEKFMKPMEAVATPEKMTNLSLGGLAGTLLCLAGAFLMWRLNKKGYWLYLAGTAVGIIVPFLIFGNNLIGIIATVIVGFVGIVFCILYGVNLKDMKEKAIVS